MDTQSPDEVKAAIVPFLVVEVDNPAALVFEVAAPLRAVTYVEHDDGFELLTAERCAALGLPLGLVWRTALLNLHRGVQTRGVQEHGEGAVRMLTYDGHLESSLLLLDWIWDVDPWPLGGRPLVAVPCRDVLVITGTEQPGGVQALRSIIHSSFDKDRAHLLSREVFERIDGAWTVHGEKRPGPA